MSEHSKSNRRDFLHGRSAAAALSEALAGPRAELPAPATSGAEPGSHLLSISREAMACLFEVVLDAAAFREKTDVAIAALERVAELEEQLTVYRDTSEVSRLNHLAAGAAVSVEPGLFQLLQRAAALSAATGGAFEVTAGRLSKIWGFYRRQGRMPVASEVAEALATVGSQYLDLNAANHTVSFTKRGLELNLGAIGKGYALDGAASVLVAGGISDFLIHGGNSSVLACGTRRIVEGDQRSEVGGQRSEVGDQKSEVADRQSDVVSQGGDGRGWTVALRHPLKPDVRLAEFVLLNQALGTSGSGTQFFHHQGRRYGHIIDPRSGWPAEQVLSATVIAPTAELADALSTAFYVLGIPGAEHYCQAHPDIAALLVRQSGTSGIELIPLNLPPETWRRL